MRTKTLLALLAAGGVATAVRAQQSDQWFAFNPPKDDFSPSSVIDLRGMNERQAGDGGFITVRGSDFIHSRTGQPVRFWGVNKGVGSEDAAVLAHDARLLAKYGVNLIRSQVTDYDAATGATNLAAIHAMQRSVAAMKAEGIYSHFSLYFPLGLAPNAKTPFLKGYNGNKPFGALFFDADFQKQYRQWWKDLLTTPDDSGHRLVDEPALFGIELVNEDSFFFWTFAAANVPDPELRIIEKQFGDWCAKKYGTLDATLQKWQGLKDARDNLAEGRLGFRPLWNMFSEKTPRDQDTAEFLTGTQAAFYADTYKYLRGLGYKGLVTASNWTTASPAVLGPLDKFTYTAGDFIDRHGYFGGTAKGPDADWAIKPGLTYSDRRSFTFESETGPAKKDFVSPVMDPSYNNRPSMISEVGWTRPNRYRSEGPLFLAAYGAWQGSDAIMHFIADGHDWSVKPGFFMQPWNQLSPTQAGQYPAAALIYRAGLVKEGDMMADINLNLRDLYALKGTPLPQGASFDELRAKDVPQGTTIQPGNVIDPLIHLVGRTNVTFTNAPTSSKLKDTQPYIDRAGQTVTSSTGQVKLDYGKGVLTINAPAAQAASGKLSDAGMISLKDLDVSSPMDNLHIAAVALDGKPLATSGKILLQVVSEEKTTNFTTQPAGGALMTVTNIGQDPWLVRDISGTVKFKRPDAATLRVTPLDFLGKPTASSMGNAAEIKLQPATTYYLVGR